MFQKDKNAFLFSLKNIFNKSTIFHCSNENYALFCTSLYGPTFGSSHDIHIADFSNLNKKSFSTLGISYSNNSPELIDCLSNENGKLFLAGEHYFQTVEIEIFQKIN
jgi:hypothetical protein